MRGIRWLVFGLAIGAAMQGWNRFAIVGFIVTGLVLETIESRRPYRRF